jgi:hypothetical protein
LVLEWERPLNISSDPLYKSLLNQNQTKLYKDFQMDKDYDVKIYYGIFNHDAEEAQWRLKGGPIPLDKSITNATSSNYN